MVRPDPTSRASASAAVGLFLLFLSVPGDAAAHLPGAVAQEVTVPEGTRLVVELRDGLSTRLSREGEVFAATVVEPVTGPDGVAVPLGATLYFTAARLEPSSAAWEPTVVRLRFDSLEARGAVRPVVATLLRAPSERASRIGTLLAVLLMAAAAGAGALAGRWLGGGGAVVTGAGVAAVLAAAALMLFQEVDAEMPAGGQMEVRLERDVELPAGQ
jgi:hypothetical protein